MSYEPPIRRPRAENEPTAQDLKLGRFSTRAGPKRREAPPANGPGAKQEPPVRRFLSREQAEALYQAQRQKRSEGDEPKSE